MCTREKVEPTTITSYPNLSQFHNTSSSVQSLQKHGGSGERLRQGGQEEEVEQLSPKAFPSGTDVPCRSDYCDSFKVLVGEHEKEFALHQALACQTSEFFRASCHSDWKEAKERVIRLPEVAEATFAIYLGWLYTSQIELIQGEDGEEVKYTPELATNIKSEVYDRLLDAYLLGDFIQDDNFCNAVVDRSLALCFALRMSPGHYSICKLWTRLPKSKMARLFVDMYSAATSHVDVRHEALDLPPGFVLEIAATMIEERHMTNSKRSPANRPKCFYHEHKKDAKCKQSSQSNVPTGQI